MEPTRPFRWGVLGTANISRAVIAAIRSGGAGRVEAVASRDAGRAGAWAARFGIPRSFGSYEALLASGGIDAVYIPLPNSLHAEWSLRAIERKIPVLCEKPFALDAVQAAGVAAAAARAGVPVAEAFMYRFHPVYDRLLEVIREGRIGKLTTVCSQFTFFLDDRSSISADPRLGGGALMDVGCYCVNLARLVAGVEPVKASALARMGDVDETMTGMLEFPGGLLAQFETSIENHERHRAEIAGAGGSILLERPWFPGEEEARLVVRRGDKEEVVVAPGANCYALEVGDFMRSCTTGEPPRWPVIDAVRNMAAIDALMRSAREGRSVPVESH